MINTDSENIPIKGHYGTWYVLSERNTIRHGRIFLLEHEMYGDDSPSLIVDEDGKVLLEDVWNGFADYDEWIDLMELGTTGLY